MASKECAMFCSKDRQREHAYRMGVASNWARRVTASGVPTNHVNAQLRPHMTIQVLGDPCYDPTASIMASPICRHTNRAITTILGDMLVYRDVEPTLCMV